jgi:hypothetical protein
MLAHINPEEAALLQSMGGAGTINPQTGLPEFFDVNFLKQFLPTPEPLPSLGQALTPEAVANVPTKLSTITIPEQRGGMGTVQPAYEKIAPGLDQYADKQYSGMGGVKVLGYTVPTEQTFAGKPLEAKYDEKGNFINLQIAGGDVLYLDPSQPNIASSPKINAKGELIDYGLFDVTKQDGGGFGDFIGGLISDFGPMILTAIGANLLAPAAGAAAGASSGTGLSLGGSGLGLTGTAGTGLNLAATTGGGLGLTAGSAGAGAIGAGLGTALNAINTGIGAGGGTTGLTLGDAGLTTGGASSGTGLTATPGTGLDLAANTGGGLGLTATPGTGLDLAATTGGGLGLTTGSAGAGTIGAGLGDTLAAIDTGIGTGLSTGVDYGLTTGGGGGGGGTGLTTGGGTGISTGGVTTGGGTLPDLSSLGGVGTAILDFAKNNPTIAGSLLGAVTSAVSGANAPKAQTTTTSIDPQIKAEYLANLERAKQTAAGLEARQIAQPGQLYTDAESKLYNLGMTPFGAADIEKFYNPYETQVVQGALGDIERTRLMQEQANRDRATAARAFGGSRQAVVSGMTNEAAMRQAANTAAQLRSAGYTQAANLGLAARPMDMAGLQTSLGLGTTRTALEQARLDALRSLGTERLGITSGALGLQPANVGQTSSQPLYSNTAGNLLSGGLTGAYIGSLLKG